MRRFILLALTAGLPLAGQQTIFNVPSADMLERGKVYGEIDALGAVHVSPPTPGSAESPTPRRTNPRAMTKPVHGQSKSG